MEYSEKEYKKGLQELQYEYVRNILVLFKSK